MTDRVLGFVAGLGNLPTMPEVATRIMRMTLDSDVSVDDLHKVIAMDQGMAAQVLRIANSAMFGMVREVRTLDRAILTLGFTTLRSVAIAAAAKGLYMRLGSGFPVKAMWHHSVATAAAARACARVARYRTPEEAFLAGLLHDIGKVVVGFKNPDLSMKVIKGQQASDALSILAAEEELFGFNHCDVGVALADAWEMPEWTAEAIRCHHDPSLATADACPLAACVALGNLLATDAGYNTGKADTLGSTEECPRALLALTDAHMEAVRVQADEAMRAAIATL